MVDQTSPEQFDAVIIGSGPSGQKAAIHLAKAGMSVAVCEQLRQIGGACVHQGTIPSKALRERAVERSKVSARLREISHGQQKQLDMDVSVAELIGEMTDIIQSHHEYMTHQLERNGVTIVHGRASFVDPHRLEVLTTTGGKRHLQTDYVVIAAGSKPRKPDNIAVDHEHIYDSDSILTLAYLPQSMVVLGGGVIACEYASIFAMLGVRVTLVDRYPQPLGFLDKDLTSSFVEAFTLRGGQFIGNADVTTVAFDGISQVVTEFADGQTLKSDKVLCAQGRVADLHNLKIANAGLALNERQLIDVDVNGRTSVDNVYAAGDVVGPPSLASASMEQGRRAACHILGEDLGEFANVIPSGIYSIPELASVGMTEAQAHTEYGDVAVGMAQFKEIARGHIAGAKDGMLKLVASTDGVIRGVHIVGVNATDLVHIGQMALLHGATVQTFIDNIFNFPTYAESYRVAAIQAAGAIPTASTASARQSA